MILPLWIHEIFSLYYHLDELVLSPTSYTSKFCSIHPNEVWVNDLFFMVPHEEYVLSISPFDDEMTREPYYLHFQKHTLLHYDDTHPHGCTYRIHLSHLETHDFPCSLPSPFDVRGTPSHTWMKRYVIEEHYCWKKHPLLFHVDIHMYGCADETSWSHLKPSCFLCSLFGSDFGGGSSSTSWMKEYMVDYLDASYILREHNYNT